MKLFAKLFIATLLLSGMAVGVSFAATRSGGGATGRTLHLIERDTSFNFLPLAGPRKGRIAKPGDEAVFAGNVLTTRNERAGHIRVGCVVAVGGINRTLQCTGTFTLPGGTLVGSGLVRANSKAATHIAILGGTGAYEGARGSILSVPSKANDNISYDTVHLLP